MARSTVDTLAADIQAMLEEYGEDVTRLTKEAVTKTGKMGDEALKSNSLSKLGGTGRYASGWRAQVEEDRMGAKVILYNSKLPGLPHLLEHGHATRNGTRNKGAREHIKPVEEKLEEALTRELEVKL